MNNEDKAKKGDTIELFLNGKKVRSGIVSVYETEKLSLALGEVHRYWINCNDEMLDFSLYSSAAIQEKK